MVTFLAETTSLLPYKDTKKSRDYQTLERQNQRNVLFSWKSHK